MPVSLYRYGDALAMSAAKGNGTDGFTVYFSLDQAREIRAAVQRIIGSIESVRFSESKVGTSDIANTPRHELVDMPRDDVPPDGADKIIADLIEWDAMMGGWVSPAWDRARAYMKRPRA